jgi:hypothetical protein
MSSMSHGAKPDAEFSPRRSCREGNGPNNQRNISLVIKINLAIVSRFSAAALGCVELTITPACAQSGLSG